MPYLLLGFFQCVKVAFSFRCFLYVYATLFLLFQYGFCFFFSKLFQTLLYVLFSAQDITKVYQIKKREEERGQESYKRGLTSWPSSCCTMKVDCRPPSLSSFATTEYPPPLAAIRDRTSALQRFSLQFSRDLGHTSTH